MNLSLPTLPIWQARSFYAQLLLMASVVLNTMGIDLMAFFGATGIGATPDEVIEKGVSIWQALSPIVFGLWAWWERRAPNYRLVAGLSGSDTTLRFLAMLAMIIAIGAATPTMAQQRCLPFDQAVQVLHERYGEELVGSGIDGQSLPVLLFVSPENHSWTLVRTVDDAGATTCILIAGLSWAMAISAPPGEPM